MKSQITCKMCEYYESDWDELTYTAYEYCLKGHGNFEGFPYQKKCKCFKASGLYTCKDEG